MQMVLSIQHGSALAIMPLHALASDQESKVTLACQDAGPVLSYHLDEFHQQVDTPTIHDQLIQMQLGTHTSVYLFASPQCLLQRFPMD